MQSFLQSVARDILAKHPEGLARVALVFPNKRASLFFNHALYEVTQQTMWTPAYLTISDLFRSHSDLQVADPNVLIFKLYNLYQELLGSSETLDHFYSWGQLMISDFDDIDKHCANADDIFANLAHWQEMGDYSFLSEQQRESLREYFGQDLDTDSLGSKFNELWQHLHTLYTDFRQLLRQENMAYEGMLYRDVVEHADGINFRYDHYIFVGFNLLQEVEHRLFRAIRQQRKVSFYWNYDHYYLDPKADRQDNEAGRHIADNLLRYPNEFPADRDDIYRQMAAPKDITYISAPTENIQARYVAEWLKAVKETDEQGRVVYPRIAAGRRTAIVLANEQLLEQVVHCLPSEVTDVNITTGFPLSSSPAATLVDALLSLQLYGLSGADAYRSKFVLPVLRHPYAHLLSPQCAPLAEALASRHVYYPSRRQLTGQLLATPSDATLDLLFSPQQPSGWLAWVADILERIAMTGRRKEDQKRHDKLMAMQADGDEALTLDDVAREKEDVFLQESLFRMYTLVSRLDAIMVPVTQEADEASASNTDAQGRQLVSNSILLRLLQQIIQTTTIPFHGEPLLGIQVMGVLETRNLDFDHVLVLSCEEGNMPKGVNDASFIPHFMRRAHGLTTIDHKVAIYSYYFHALMQRAHDVTMTYNNATEDGQKHEMSRFMLQYMAENVPVRNEEGRIVSGQDIRRMTLLAGQNATKLYRREVLKDQRVTDRLMQIRRLSPSAINRYLRCPLQFYYNSVCQLQEADNDNEEEINSQDFGNIFHCTAELIYKSLGHYDEATGQYRHEVTVADIQPLLKDDKRLDPFLDQAFAIKLFHLADVHATPRYNGQQMLNREVIREYIKHLLRFDSANKTIIFKGLELDVSDKLSFVARLPQGERPKEIELFGQIDRLDQVVDAHGNAVVRVVDYKTGKKLETKPADVEQIFDPKYVDLRHTAYYLQTFLYAGIVRHGMSPQHGSSLSAQAIYNKENNPVAPALYFIREANTDNYDPTLQLKPAKADAIPVTDIATYYDDFMARLRQLLEEIWDASIPFRPTPDEHRCTTCPYAALCGL